MCAAVLRSRNKYTASQVFEAQLISTIIFIFFSDLSLNIILIQKKSVKLGIVQVLSKEFVTSSLVLEK